MVEALFAGFFKFGFPKNRVLSHSKVAKSCTAALRDQNVHGSCISQDLRCPLVPMMHVFTGATSMGWQKIHVPVMQAASKWIASAAQCSVKVIRMLAHHSGCIRVIFVA